MISNESIPKKMKSLVLKEVGNLSLEELGKLLKKPIGKSGVKHRMNKISEISSEI